MRAIVLCLAAAPCLAQVFDAVSVKAVSIDSHPVFGNRGGPGTADPGRIHLCCVGMYSLLMRAYEVEVDRIAGPSWILDNMGPNLYEVDATMPPDTTKAQFQLMMQSLLAERFHLVMHRESRNFPGYDLVIARGGAKLKESTPDPNATAADGPRMTTSLGHGMVRVQAQQKPLSELVRTMGSLIAQGMGADPSDFSTHKARVIDRTGLTGTYDFTLQFACEGCRGVGSNLPLAGRGQTDSPSAADPGDAPDIFTAFEKQLGLRLEKAKDIPLDVIVVDRADKVPTAN
jgi:uncharacterized protein (TIGR03435 family)